MDTDAAAGEAEVDLSASEAAAKAAAMNAVQMDMSQWSDRVRSCATATDVAAVSASSL